MENTAQQQQPTSLDAPGLKGAMYQAELELKKLHTLEIYRVEDRLPAQRKSARDACTDLIEVLQTLITALDSTE